MERGGDACVPPEREVSRVFSWGGIPGGGARGGPPPVRGVGVVVVVVVRPNPSKVKKASKIPKEPCTRRKNPKRQIPAFVARFHLAWMSQKAAALAMVAKGIFFFWK